MDIETLIPEFHAILVAVGVQEKEANVSTAKLDVEPGHGRLVPQNLLDAELEILGLWCLKRNGEELVDNGGMDTRNGVTEKDDENFLGAHIQQGSESNLGLVCERLGLVKDNHFRPGCHEEGIEGGSDEGVHATTDRLESTLVTRV